ncbi:regulatory phage cox family protein [Planctobacterium marinum]|uniref:regulatory phage cox family protein n=1 Tax=Planctobacterium marinum TaxID=1631968 RepID=UPI001E475862|nr:regulatory phage cox family protein [Planctobacterium marinum]MCC2604103.1 regulatory phage cox family protein [Planctobacterium marinum]
MESADLSIDELLALGGDPIATPERFSEMMGKTIKAVSHDMDRGLIPYIQLKQAGKRYVNMVKFRQQLLSMQSSGVLR